MNDKTVYVWNFNAKEAISKDLAESITDEFEQALIKSRICIVLQRRHYKKLFNQRQQEMKIKGLESIDKESIELIKEKDAELVIFGEVHDDDASGQIKISAIVQDFDTKILASESVHCPRSVKSTPQSRMEHLIKLVGMIASSGEDGGQKSADKNFVTQLPIALTVADFRITLTEIILNGTNLDFIFEVVNRSQTRTLSISRDNTLIYDDTGRQIHPTNISIGGLKNRKDMVPGIPIDMKFSFEGVFDDVIWVPQLHAKFYLEGWHDLKFHNLRIPR